MHDLQNFSLKSFFMAEDMAVFTKRLLRCSILKLEINIISVIKMTLQVNSINRQQSEKLNLKVGTGRHIKETHFKEELLN
jgi:hypothetical protein